MSVHITEKNNRQKVKSRYSFHRLLLGSDLSVRRLPVMSVQAPEAGPAIWLTACVHGDEVCGMVVIHEVFRKARKRLTRGSIHALPLMNPFGFEHGSRKITLSQEDLNRCFPGNEAGTLGERAADTIFSMIMESHPSLVIDLHNDWKRSIPYVVLDACHGDSAKPTYNISKKIALDTGLVVIQEQEIIGGSLSYNLLLRSVPALTLELGEPYVINEANVSAGVKAIWNVLLSLDVCEPLEPGVQPLCSGISTPGNIYHFFDRPYSSASGIVRFLAQPGETIRSGQPFARIVNAFGKHQETINSLHDGIILGHTDSSVVFPGMPIMAFGVRTVT